ncbi:T9SS type A sorting domain-containing protein [Flavobacterium zepuense]|uniref:T9SS type A sorting domain-containing protein n=1 Tax=Flavobacterium zepuense TaxID=2593302 RepID=A0A552UVA8_9FLAO|nr:T9SS type A sorting domain-containing protein [Flavobacterium zepuense]
MGASEPAEKIDYIIVEATTGLDGVTGLDNVSIYPNPTQGNVTVQINEEAGQDVSVEVLDFLGRSVYTTTATSTGASQKIELNLEGLMGDQVFFIRLNVGDKSGSYKLIKN